MFEVDLNIQGSVDMLEFIEEYPELEVVVFPSEYRHSKSDKFKSWKTMAIYRWLRSIDYTDYVYHEIADPTDAYSTYPFWIVGFYDKSIAVWAKLRYQSLDYEKR